MKTLKKLTATVGALCVIMILTGGYIFYIEPLRITVEQVEIRTEKQLPDEGVRVVQFSDTHLGEDFSLAQLRRTVKKINTLKPDIVLFTGDLVDRMAGFEERDAIAPILDQITAPIGKFAVWGNHDYGGGGVRYYEEIMADSGFTLLTNEGAVMELTEDCQIEIIGLDDALFGAPDLEITRAVEPQGTFGLLMIHEPDVVEDLREKDVDLIASGHSHGGQIWLPGYGALVTTTLAEKYTRGLYELDSGKQLYVNPGLGTTKIKARWFNPPEITLFKILPES